MPYYTAIFEAAADFLFTLKMTHFISTFRAENYQQGPFFNPINTILVRVPRPTEPKLLKINFRGINKMVGDILALNYIYLFTPLFFTTGELSLPKHKHSCIFFYQGAGLML